jgi:hypothetical protein
MSKFDEFQEKIENQSSEGEETRISSQIIETEAFVVKQTSLIGCDFLGLFADKDFSEGSIICIYTGKVLRTKEALKLEDKSYLMRLGEQCYIDAKDTLEVLARYINDCVNPKGWNVRFDKSAENQCAYVVALRNISKGEEIFVDYGKWYWAGKKPVKEWS